MTRKSVIYINEHGNVFKTNITKQLKPGTRSGKNGGFKKMSTYKYHFNSINGTQEITISDGNKKCKGNGVTEFMIFNLPAETTCPFASDDCKRFCYAKKSERIYKAVRACRERNYMATLEPEFVPAMVNLICDTLKRNKYVNAKHIVIRIHESGDFYSPEYFAAWDRIAGYFEGDSRITFIAYTKAYPIYITVIPLTWLFLQV